MRKPSIDYTLVGIDDKMIQSLATFTRDSICSGKVKDLIWTTGTSSSSSSSSSGASDVIERIKPGYDRAGNRLYRMNLADSTRLHDEYYWYDHVDRLNDMERGRLNASNTGIEILEFAQCWSLDSTGNWSGFRRGTSLAVAPGISSRNVSATRSMKPVSSTLSSARPGLPQPIAPRAT